MLCDAQIAQLREDPRRTLDALVRALEIADGDLILPFTRMADVFAPLLTRHPTLAQRWPAPPTLTSTDLADDVGPTTPQRLPEPLTNREQAVLRLLTTSMSTTEIASELYLSVNTVKTHLAAIYRKLAARKRREAVQRARELELL